MTADGLDMPCLDCGQQLLPNGRQGHEWFMLHDHVWAQTGLAPDGGFLCVGCIERRIGRRLTGEDLSDEVPINSPGELDSPRMHALKVAAIAAR